MRNPTTIRRLCRTCPLTAGRLRKPAWPDLELTATELVKGSWAISLRFSSITDWATQSLVLLKEKVNPGQLNGGTWLCWWCPVYNPTPKSLKSSRRVLWYSHYRFHLNNHYRLKGSYIQISVSARYSCVVLNKFKIWKSKWRSKLLHICTV